MATALRERAKGSSGTIRDLIQGVIDDPEQAATPAAILDALEGLADRLGVSLTTWGIASAMLALAAGALEWRTRQDARVRESHRIDGQLQANDGTFTLRNGNTCTAPGDPDLPPEDTENCRCRLVDPLGDGDEDDDATTTPATFRLTRWANAARLNDATTNDGATAMSQVGDPSNPQASGPIVFEGVQTGDRRLIDPNALELRPDPDGLPFHFMNEQTAWGHLGSLLAGVHREFGRSAVGDGVNAVNALVEFNNGSDWGRTASQAYAGGWVRGVSVDLDMAEYEYRDPETGRVFTDYMDMYEHEMAGGIIVLAFTRARIMGSTGTSHPAFAKTRLELVAEEQAQALVASAGYQPTGRAVWRLDVPFPDGWGRTPAAAMVASLSASQQASQAFDVGYPYPAPWFAAADRVPDQPFPMTILPNGQVDGYFALWNVPHPITGEKPRPSRCNYKDARTGTATTTAGELATARAWFKTQHPSVFADYQMSTNWYNSTGAVCAQFVPYEDRHGIRSRGGVRFGATVAEVAEAKASGFSGDWREGTPNGTRGHRELIGVLNHPDPAFLTNGETPEQFAARYANHPDPMVAMVASMTGNQPAPGQYGAEPLGATALGALSHSEQTIARLVERMAKVEGFANAGRRAEVLDKLRATLPEHSPVRLFQGFKW